MYTIFPGLECFVQSCLDSGATCNTSQLVEMVGHFPIVLAFHPTSISKIVIVSHSHQHNPEATRRIPIAMLKSGDLSSKKIHVRSALLCDREELRVFRNYFPTEIADVMRWNM